MTLDIFVLVVVSAVIHPLWNMVIKKELYPERAFFIMMLGTVLIAFLHIFMSGSSFVLPSSSWWLIGLSVLGQIIYAIALTSTYKKGDISIYYPIIRASPLFVIAVGFLFLGSNYDWNVIVGVLIVIAAGSVLAIQPGKAIGFEPKVFILALSAMCGTGIYSMADGAASQDIPAPVLFFYVQLILAIVYGAIMRTMRRFHFSALFNSLEVAFVRRCFLASILVYGSYVLILYAYAMGGDVALVTTARQISIPLSVLMGGIWLKESGMAQRFVAAVVLSAGIALAMIA